MEINDIINLIVNNSVAIGVLIYFIVRDWKFTQRLDTTLLTLQKSIDSVEKILKRMEKQE